MVSFGYWVAVVGGDLALVLATFVAIASAAQRVLAPARRRRFLAIVGFAGVAWAALVASLAARGVFHYGAAYPFPYIGLAVALPVLGGAVAMWRSAPVRSVASAIPQEWLIGIQTIRVIGAVFLVALLEGRLPAVFALPAGIGDVLVGLAAPLVALRVRGQEPQAERATALWNMAGILDLVVAIAIGFLASTTPYRLIFSTPSTDVATALPLVLIPAFGVPLFLLLHIASLQTLRAALRKGRLERRPPVATAAPPVRRPA